MKKIIELVKLNKYNTSAQKALKTISDLSLIIRERESYGFFSLNDEELNIVSDIINTQKHKVYGSVVFDDDFISGEKHKDVIEKVSKEIQHFNWETISELKSKKSIYEALVDKINNLNISQKECVEFLVKWYKYKDVFKFKMVNSFLDRNLKYLEFSQSKINDYYSDFNNFLENFQYNNAASFTENYNKLFYEAFYRKNNVWKTVIDRLIQTQNNCMSELEMYSEQYNLQQFSDEEKEFGLAQIKFNEHKKIVEDFECLELLIDDIEKEKKNKIELLMTETENQFEALINELHESHKYYSKLFEIYPNSNNSIISAVIKEHISKIEEASESIKMLHTAEVVELLTYLREKMNQNTDKYLDVFTAKFSKLSDTDKNDHDKISNIIDEITKTIHFAKYDVDYYVELSKKNSLEINLEFNEKIAELRRNTKNVNDIKIEKEKEDLNKLRTIYTAKVDSLLGSLNSEAVAKAKTIENISESFASAENDAILTKIYKKFDNAVELLRTQAKEQNIDSEKVEEFENLLTSCISFDELYEDKLDVIYENFVKLEYLYQVEKGTPNVIRKVAQSFIQESDAIRVLEFVGMRPEKSLQSYDALTDKDKISAVFAYMLVSSPKLLIIEENDLWETPGLRNHFITLMKNAQAHKAVGTLYVGNNIDAMLEITEKTMIMHNGRIIEYGDSRLLASNAVHIYTKDLFNKKSMLYENVHHYSSDSEIISYAREYSEVDAPHYRKVSENHFVFATESQFESWLRNEEAKIIKEDVIEENLMHSDMEVMIPTLPTVLVEKNIEEVIEHGQEVEEIIELEKKHENVAVNIDHISEDRLQEMIRNAEYVEEFDESTVVYGKNLTKSEALKLLQAQVKAKALEKENSEKGETVTASETKEVPTTPLEKEIAKEEEALHKKEEKIEALREEYAKEDVVLVEGLIKEETKLIASEIVETQKQLNAEEKTEAKDEESNKKHSDKDKDEDELENKRKQEEKRLEKERLEEERKQEEKRLEKEQKEKQLEEDEKERLSKEKQIEKERILEEKRLEKERLEEERRIAEELLEEELKLEKELQEEKRRIEEMRLEKERLEKARLDEQQHTIEERIKIEKSLEEEKRKYNEVKKSRRDEMENHERNSRRRDEESDDRSSRDSHNDDKRFNKRDERDDRDNRDRRQSDDFDRKKSDYRSNERNDRDGRFGRHEDNSRSRDLYTWRLNRFGDRRDELEKREESLYDRKYRIGKRFEGFGRKYARDEDESYDDNKYQNHDDRDYRLNRRDEEFDDRRSSRHDERDDRDYRVNERYDEREIRDSRNDDRRSSRYDERDDRDYRRNERHDDRDSRRDEFDEQKTNNENRHASDSEDKHNSNASTNQAQPQQNQQQSSNQEPQQVQPQQPQQQAQPIQQQVPTFQQPQQVVFQYPPQPKFYYQQAPQYHPPIIHPLPGEDVKLLNTLEFILDKKLLEAEKRSFENEMKNNEKSPKGEVLNNKLIKKLLKEVEDLEKTITLKLGE